MTLLSVLLFHDVLFHVFHVGVAQGPLGPDGPPGETGPEGTKVKLLKTTMYVLNLKLFFPWSKMDPIFNCRVREATSDRRESWDS